MTCIRPGLRIALSTYMGCMQGASKPFSHMTCTITSLSAPSGSRPRFECRSRRVLLTMCGCRSGGWLAAPGHHDLNHAGCVVRAVPFRAQGDNLVVEGRADAPTHTHCHGLAVQRGHAVFEVLHDVRGDEAQALLRAHKRPSASLMGWASHRPPPLACDTLPRQYRHRISKYIFVII